MNRSDAWKDELIRRALPLMEKVASGGTLTDDERHQAFGWTVRHSMETRTELWHELDRTRDQQ